MSQSFTRVSLNIQKRTNEVLVQIIRQNMQFSEEIANYCEYLLNLCKITYSHIKKVEKSNEMFLTDRW